jgi:hypothetical protein
MKERTNDRITKEELSRPDDMTKYPKINIETVRVGSFEVKRLTAEPGQRWSESVGPTLGNETCPLDLVVWVDIQGRFAVRMDDGAIEEFGTGDVGRIGQGHDAWVVGDEVVVGIDIQAAPEE